MKKILCSLGLFIFLFSLALNSVKAMSFDEALSQSDAKPALVLIYADWADNVDTYLDKFALLKKEFGDKFNYIELDIADPDTKSFNARYHIYPHLPYLLMFKDGGKVSRYIQRNCVSSEACLIPRVKQFIQ